MKSLLYFLAAALIIISCSTSKEATTSKQEKKMIKKLAEQAVVKQAVESRRYVMRMDKLYMDRGGYVDLVPNNNFLIVNGETASVSLLYMGPTMGARPISGINFNGHTIRYEMKSDETKGLYTVSMRVRKGTDNFDFYITIGANGTCSFSVVNSYIESVTYKGVLVPIPATDQVISNNPNRI